MTVKRTEGKADHLRLVPTREMTKGASGGSAYFLDEADFNEILSLERKRSRRSLRPLMLMRLDLSGVREPSGDDVRRKLVRALASGIRDTDVRGWCKRDSIVGIVFTELKSAASDVREVLFSRVMAKLAGHIDPGVLFTIRFNFNIIYPEDGENSHACDRFDMDCYKKDVAEKSARRDLSSRIRVIKDIVATFLMT